MEMGREVREEEEKEGLNRDQEKAIGLGDT